MITALNLSTKEGYAEELAIRVIKAGAGQHPAEVTREVLIPGAEAQIPVPAGSVMVICGTASDPFMESYDPTARTNEEEEAIQVKCDEAFERGERAGYDKAALEIRSANAAAGVDNSGKTGAPESDAAGGQIRPGEDEHIERELKGPTT